MDPDSLDTDATTRKISTGNDPLAPGRCTKSKRPKEPQVITAVEQVPMDNLELPDYALRKLFRRLFPRATIIDYSARTTTGVVLLAHAGKQCWKEDMDFVTKYFRWEKNENGSFVWNLMYAQPKSCVFPLMGDCFKVSYMRPGINRKILRSLFPTARSISIFNTRMRNDLIPCLKFTVGEALLKFDDPMEASENYCVAKNISIDGIPIRVVEEDQTVFLANQRTITIRGIPDHSCSWLPCFLRRVFPFAYDVTIHWSPIRCNSTATIWFCCSDEALDAYEESWLSKISPLWMEFICPYAIKISNIDQSLSRANIKKAMTDLFQAPFKIHCGKKRSCFRFIHVYFKTEKETRQAFKYLTEVLGWEARSDHHVVSNFTPLPQRLIEDENLLLKREENTQEAEKETPMETVPDEIEESTKE